ncbi:MAG: LemA protein [Candidatus Binatota bacterium]|jgi:LemA protein|nr:LemA protein [Candidatus Binatota bacterium]
MLWVLLVVLAVAVAAVLVYNTLVRLRVQSDNAWADIDVQLKRRHDLVPNLVETVKGYAAHERETLEGVIAARNRAVTAAGPTAQGEAETQLTQSLRQLFALAESYPQLRAVESFNQLQTNLGEIESSLQSARRYYNAVVRDLNTRVEQFPSNLIAGGFGFQRREFFEIDDAAERATPRVSFGER